MAFIENMEEIKEESKNVDVKDILNWIQPGIKTSISGRELRSSCVVHGGDGQNLSINLNTHAWKCHSKGCTGTNLIDLYAQNKGYGKDQFYQATEEFAQQFGITVKYKETPFTSYTKNHTLQPKESSNKTLSNKLETKEKETKSYKKEDVIQCWNEASQEGLDTYFHKKKLQPPPNARFGKNANGYHSTQIDYCDIDGNLKYILCLGGGKFQYKVCDDISGAFHQLGEFNPTGRLYVGEGIATAQTAWEANQRKIPAISCGSWSNILPVLRDVIKKYPNIKPVILIDCDDGGNGLKAAKEIAEEFPQAIFRKPNFKNLPNPQNHPQKELKDFNDMISKCDGILEDVKQQLEVEYILELDEKDNDYRENSTKEIINKKEAPTVKTDSKTHGRCETASESLKKLGFIEKIKNRKLEYEKSGVIKISGVPSNFIKLDSIIDGLQGGHLIILAGRTGMGKTFMALNMIKNIAIDQKIPTSLYSLEMSNTQVFYRLISLCSGIPATKIKRGTINDQELEEVEKAIKLIENAPLFMTDEPANSILTTLSSNINASCQAGESKIAFIDHIGLVNCGSNYKDNRANEMGKITMTNKIIAKQHNIPIICLAQLNREADSKTPPKLSQLRESGNLEQDADIVMFVHRRDYYEKEDKPGQVDIIVEKNREGDTGTVTFEYNKTNWIVKEIPPIKDLMTEVEKSKNKRIISNQKINTMEAFYPDD